MSSWRDVLFYDPDFNRDRSPRMRACTSMMQNQPSTIYGKRGMLRATIGTTHPNRQNVWIWYVSTMALAVGVVLRIIPIWHIYNLGQLVSLCNSMNGLEAQSLSSHFHSTCVTASAGNYLAWGLIVLVVVLLLTKVVRRLNG